MNEFFESLSTLEKIYVVSAFIGTMLFLVRLVLQFIGHDSHMFGDVDGVDVDMNGVDVHDIHYADMDSDSLYSFKLLTFQGLTSFFMMFGLVGIALTRGSGVNFILSIIGAVAAGLATVWVTTKLFQLMSKLQSSGTIRNESAVGAEGTVYLRIPPGGTGKVTIRIADKLREYEATSDEDEEIPTGANIRVTRVVSGNIMVVQKV